MNSNKYATAGWLCLASAVLIAPTIALGFFLDYIARSYPAANVLQILLSILFCALGVYILYIFKNLLNLRYQFHLTDNLILTLIWINIIITILGFLKYFVPEVGIGRLTLGIMVITLFFIMGIINIGFGTKCMHIGIIINTNTISVRNQIILLSICRGV